MALGTMAMLENAVSHSKTMAETGKLYHQAMGVKLGQGDCVTTLSAENVAVFWDGSVKNPAAKCIMQWRYSAGHFRNMMSETSKVCAVGVHQKTNSNWWCAQTFSWDNPDVSCRMNIGFETPTPSISPSTSPTLMLSISETSPQSTSANSAVLPPTSQPSPSGSSLASSCMKFKKINVVKMDESEIEIVQACTLNQTSCSCRFRVISENGNAIYSTNSSRYLAGLFSSFFF